MRSSAFRIALAFAAAVTTTTYIVFALVYYEFYSRNVVLVRAVLQDELRNATDEPADNLKQHLELRLTQDLRHLDYVGLYDAHGVLVFGNVSPNLAVPTDGTSHLIRTNPPQPTPWQSENVIFVSAKREDGGKLVLGRSLVYVDQLGTAMLHSFAAAIAPIIMLALLTSTIVSLRASRRFSMIQSAINRVMQGDLDIRLPARGTSDDVDELVIAVNHMLDEIVRLINQIKSVGDNIAHDLRAPLAIMRSRLERGLAGPSEEMLQTVIADALLDLDRALTTVAALLRISELEGTLRRRTFAPVDLTAVCRDAIELYRPLGEAKNLALTLHAPSPIFVQGDEDLLREALANLLDNAIKFTPCGGSIWIDCDKPGSLVRVRDSGPGIEAEEKDKILTRFYRARSTSASPGFGLGLSMAKTIMELHGLTLHVGENEPGAVFEISTGNSSHPYQNIN